MRFLFILLTMGLMTGHVMASTEKTIYGYIEKTTLVDHNLTLSTKLDTGAKSASLNAENIQKIQIKGKPYLSFTVPSKEGDIAFQAEHVGNVKIKVRSGERKANPLLRSSVKRPVVLLPVKIADKLRTIRVNLTNRKRFIYPFLLGREAIIAFNGIIDPSQKYTANPINTDKP